MQRIHRLLKLVTLLQNGSCRSAMQLARELNVSRRTLFRDLNMLEQAGIPYYHKPAEGYRIARSFFLPPTSLTVPETLGLMLLAKSAGKRSHWPLKDSAIGAIKKLVATVPDPIRAACNELMNHVSVDLGPQGDDAAGSTHYPTLQRCIDETRACTIQYRSPVDPGPIRCRLHPYVLHFAERSWYVLGWTDMHQDVRVFKLARIESLEPSAIRFAPPEGFRVEHKLGKAWRMIPEGRIYQVELEFTPKVATNVTEVLWHPSQSHRMLPDGRCRVCFEVDGLAEIAWWICGYADQVMVRKPAALKQRVQRMHQAAMQRYQKASLPAVRVQVPKKKRDAAGRT